MIRHSKIFYFRTPNYDDLDKEIPQETQGGKQLVGAELHSFIHFQRLTEGTSIHTHGLIS